VLLKQHVGPDGGVDVPSITSAAGADLRPGPHTFIPVLHSASMLDDDERIVTK
jgi:hypothetical protein